MAKRYAAGRETVALLLVDHGADLDAKDAEGKTPIQSCVDIKLRNALLSRRNA